MNDTTLSDEREQVSSALTTIDDSLAIGLTRAEVDQQISTARKFPRSTTVAIRSILSLATLNEETAAACMYALPRGKDDEGRAKTIEGPSVRLAEIVSQCWGNCRVSDRVTHVDRIEKVVEAEGIYHDLETNMARRVTVRRRISGRSGRIFSDDMIVMTGNAARAIASRNAIFAGVPRGVWWSAYVEARKVVEGDTKTLEERRKRVLDAFKTKFDVDPEKIFAKLGLGGADDIQIKHMPVLTGMLSALHNDESTVDEMFSIRETARGSVGDFNPMGEQQEGPKTTPSPDTAKTAETTQSGPKTAESPPADQKARARTRQKPPGGTDIAPEKERATDVLKPAERPTPKTAGEFAVYWKGFLEAVTDPARIDAQWEDDAALRKACQVSPKESKALVELGQQRAKELNK